MTPQEYLEQACSLDRSINSKLAQVTALNELAQRSSAVLTGIPRSPNRATSIMADAIDKLIDMQAEINRDIDRLIDLKREIASVISRVDKHDYRTLLERRYLGFETWDKIAAALGYSIQHVYRLRDKALAEVQVPIKTGESM